MTTRNDRILCNDSIRPTHYSQTHACVETIDGVDYFAGVYNARDAASVVRIRTLGGRTFRAERVLNEHM